MTPGVAAAADSISLSFGPDPTEEVPFAVTATTPAGDGDVYVTRKPSGPLGCAPTYAADEPNSNDVMYGRDPGTATTNWTEDEPGAFTFCGYLVRNGSTTAVTGAVALTVRDARAAVALSAPARVDRSRQFVLNVQVTAELARNLYVTIKPAGGRGCEPNYAADETVSSDVIYGTDVQGAQTVQRNVTAPSTNGTYLLCAYVDERTGGTPEATASTSFLVGPDPCSVAKAAVTKSAKRVKAAERAVVKYRRSYRRYARQAGHASGARARYLRKLSKRDKSRYRSAIRSRAKRRAALADAQAAVTATCPAT
jgi:hypothetical protein